MADPRTARVVLGLPSGQLELELAVTSGPASVDQLLPLARSLTEQIVELTVIQVEEQGRKILPRGAARAAGNSCPSAKPRLARFGTWSQHFPSRVGRWSRLASPRLCSGWTTPGC